MFSLDGEHVMTVDEPAVLTPPGRDAPPAAWAHCTRLPLCTATCFAILAPVFSFCGLLHARSSSPLPLARHARRRRRPRFGRTGRSRPTTALGQPTVRIASIVTRSASEAPQMALALQRCARGDPGTGGLLSSSAGPAKIDTSDGPRGIMTGTNQCNSSTEGPKSLCVNAVVNGAWRSLLACSF